VRVRFAARPWGVIAACLLAGLMCCVARAAPAGERYFIDFRSRPSSYIGHTYILYFRVGADGRVIEKHYAGLIPEKDVLMGLIGPIRATVREYKDDSRLTPTAIYRRRINAAEYRKVAGLVRHLHRVDRQWHAMFHNCNDFGVEIAQALGLNRPPSLLPPSAWVTMLRKFNEPGS
jgi:hypothetical protein